MIFDILKYPDDQEKLRVKCKKVEKITEDVEFFCKSLMETLAHSGGIGLAANQVGANSRIIALNFGRPFVIINPRIVQTNKIRKLSKEGCLSCDGEFTVFRDQKITVQALDLSGGDFKKDFNGPVAFCLQHEIDHLNGVLVVDRTLKKTGR